MAGIDAHELLLETTVNHALYSIAVHIAEAARYMEDAPATAGAGSSSPSLMTVLDKTWKMAPFPESLNFLLRTGESAPFLPEIAIRGLERMYAALKAQEEMTEVNAQDFLRRFYKKTTQSSDGWVDFSIFEDGAKKMYTLSLLDVFAVTSAAMESWSESSASSSEESGPAGAGTGAGGASAVVSGEVSAATIGKGWAGLTSYLLMDQEVVSACSTRYRDSMMIGLRHVGHPEAKSIFPGAQALLNEALLACFQTLRPAFGLDYAKTLLTLLGSGVRLELY